MRHVHGECDGVGRIKPLDAALSVHALDGLKHACVLAVKQLHALLHYIQRRDNGVVNNRRASTSEHVPKNLVAVTAALERLLAEFVSSKVEGVAGYSRTAHGSDTPVKR